MVEHSIIVPAGFAGGPFRTAFPKNSLGMSGTAGSLPGSLHRRIGPRTGPRGRLPPSGNPSTDPADQLASATSGGSQWSTSMIPNSHIR